MSGGNERAAVRISADKMSAEINIPAVSPHPSLPELHALLASHGVVYGILNEALAEAVKAPGTWKEAARGTPVTPPIHGRVEHHFDFSSKPKISVDEHGAANLKELGLLENVTAGFKLATLVPPTLGSPGRNVFGAIIMPDDARPGVLLPGKNTSISKDGVDLIADIDGRVMLDHDGRISVDNVYTVIGDVGPATGNINFLGSVVVSGKICSDYRVKASQKIIVSGSVEGAVLDAGQEITVKGGVAGGGHALLQSPGDIHVKFAQDAKIFCGGTLRVDQDLIRVNAIAAQSILVENGAIIGGAVTAPRVIASKLGSESDTHTIVEFGISPRCKLICSRLEQEFVLLREALVKARRRLQPLQARYNAGKIMSMEERNAMEVLEGEVNEFEAKLISIAAAVREQVSSPASDVPGELKISGTTYPGVILSTNRQVRAVSHEVRSLAATAAEGKMSGGGEER